MTTPNSPLDDSPLNLKGPIDEARIQYFRPHELQEDECYELSVLDVTPKGDDYQWYAVATFPSWDAADQYAHVEFPYAHLIGRNSTTNSDDANDDDGEG